MRISSSNIGMESARSYHSIVAETIVIAKKSTAVGTFTEGDTSKTRKKENAFGDYFSSNTEDAEDTESAEEKLEDSILELGRGIQRFSCIQSYSSNANSDTVMTIRVRTLLYLINLLANDETGSLHKSKKSGSNKPDNDEASFEELFKDLQGYDNEMTGVNTVTSIYASTLFAENESTSFETSGTVVTKDGRELNFGIQMQMSRSFVEKYDVSMIEQSVSYCDPLVINLDTDAAKISDQKFLFDIDSDGTKDSISQLSKESGYLALDLNEDGVINNGSELFGTKSGNGFKDLAQYDSDGDGWIDEDDEVWSKLLIWSKDDTGNDVLFHLKDKGIGAICLKNTSTNFSLNSSTTNEVNARIRNTGIFLYENGSVGTVQHLDLAK